MRSTNWIKIKNLKSEIFIIGGYYEEKKNYVFSIVLGELKNNKLIHVGNASVSKKNKLYKKIKNLKKIDKSPFNNFNKKQVNYIDSFYKVEIRYLERTSSNNLRQPIFVKEVL